MQVGSYSDMQRNIVSVWFNSVNRNHLPWLLAVLDGVSACLINSSCFMVLGLGFVLETLKTSTFKEFALLYTHPKVYPL